MAFPGVVVWPAGDPEVARDTFSALLLLFPTLFIEFAEEDNGFGRPLLLLLAFEGARMANPPEKVVVIITLSVVSAVRGENDVRL